MQTTNPNAPDYNPNEADRETYEAFRVRCYELAEYLAETLELELGYYAPTTYEHRKALQLAKLANDIKQGLETMKTNHEEADQ